MLEDVQAWDGPYLGSSLRLVKSAQMLGPRSPED